MCLLDSGNKWEVVVVFLLFPEVNIEEELRNDSLEGALGLFSSKCGTNVWEHVCRFGISGPGPGPWSQNLHFQEDSM